MKGLFLVLFGFCCLSVIAQEPRMILPESYADFKEIAFNPNGKQLLVSAGDSTILLFDVNTGRRLYSLKTLNNDISFGTSGDLFAVTDNNYPNEKSLIYYAKTFNMLFECKGEIPRFTKDSKLIASNNSDHISLCSIDTGSQCRTFANSEIREFSFNVKVVLLLSPDHILNHNIESGELIYSIDMANDLFIHSAVYSPTRNQIHSLQDRAGKKEVVLINNTTEKLENGIFTHAILEYIATHQREEITVNALKKYVEDRVEELTDGMQKPTSRQDTMDIDWGLFDEN